MNFPSPPSRRKVGDPTVSTRVEGSLSHTGKRRRTKTREVSSLDPESRRMTGSTTSKNPMPNNPSHEFQMKLRIDTDDAI